jgi:hypothetical protein
MNANMIYLLWKCRNFNMQRTKNNINTESLKDDKKEAMNVVNFLRESGLIYQIWIMTTMNKHSQRKTHLMENIQGWHDDDRNKQIWRRKKHNGWKTHTRMKRWRLQWMDTANSIETGRENMKCMMKIWFIQGALRTFAVIEPANNSNNNHL